MRSSAKAGLNVWELEKQKQPDTQKKLYDNNLQFDPDRPSDTTTSLIARNFVDKAQEAIFFPKLVKDLLQKGVEGDLKIQCEEYLKNYEQIQGLGKQYNNETENDQLLKQLENLKKEIVDEDKALNEKNKEMANIVHCIRSATETATQYRKLLEQEELDQSIASRLLSEQREIKQLEQTVKELKQERDQMGKTLKREYQSISNTEKKLADRNASHTEIKKSKFSLESQLINISRCVRDLELQISSLTEEIKSEKSKIEEGQKFTGTLETPDLLLSDSSSRSTLPSQKSPVIYHIEEKRRNWELIGWMAAWLLICLTVTLSKLM